MDFYFLRMDIFVDFTRTTICFFNLNQSIDEDIYKWKFLYGSCI